VDILVKSIPYSEVFLILTEVFPCFFLSCNANARVKLAKTGHGLHSSTLFVICVVLLLFVLFYVLFVCKCVLPPGDNSNAVNKYVISYISYNIYHIIYHIISLSMMKVSTQCFCVLLYVSLALHLEGVCVPTSIGIFI
jgi:hypothetical protein